MKRPARNRETNSLAEHLAAKGHACSIPYAHDRLNEAHHWWHEIARWYHEPEPFRYRLGAFIQAARNVTFMLQKEKSAFANFHWYDEWVESARGDATLRWLRNTRVAFVHRQALEPYSWLELRCINNPREVTEEDMEPLVGRVSPFECTHYYMNGPCTDHAHEFTRNWGIEGLVDREILDVCAEIYDRLDDLVEKAHEEAGAKSGHEWDPGENHNLPCMDDIMKYRVVRTVLRDGHEVWEDEPPGPYNHE